jgi:hypothetical protein
MAAERSATALERRSGVRREDEGRTCDALRARPSSGDAQPRHRGRRGLRAGLALAARAVGRVPLDRSAVPASGWAARRVRAGALRIRRGAALLQVRVATLSSSSPRQARGHASCLPRGARMRTGRRGFGDGLGGSVLPDETLAFGFPQRLPRRARCAALLRRGRDVPRRRGLRSVAGDEHEPHRSPARLEPGAAVGRGRLRAH